MATTRSQTAPSDRVARRRRATIDEALDLATAVMTEAGVGGLTVSEVARRMGVRPPSLYKYFPSLHAMYDALYARGVAASDHAVSEAIAELPAGRDRIGAGCRAVVRWCVENPALGQLLYWRPVPGFEPSTAAFAGSVDQMAGVRAELAAAVEAGELHPDADSDVAVRLLTVLLSGLVSQQMANQPGASFRAGRFSSLTDDAISLFLHRYAPTSQET